MSCPLAATPPPQGVSGLIRIQGKEQQISERDCRRTISRYRQRIDWLLKIPEWEAIYAAGLVEKSLPQPRRGINLRTVLDSLLLEHKFSLVLWALETVRKPLPTKYVLRLANDYALNFSKPEAIKESIKLDQWDAFTSSLRFVLNKEHAQYKRAQTVLFRRYKSLLHKMVNRQVFDSSKRPDAYQEASLGLIHAIDKVEDNAASFGSYARTWISRQIKNFLMGEHFPVHVPINLASKILRSQSGENDHKLEGSEKLKDLVKPGVSLDQMQDGDDEHPGQEVVDEVTGVPSEKLTDQDIYDAVHQLMSELTDKQREVLELRYGLRSEKGSATLASIAQQVGISHQQVSMREKRALQKLEAVLKPIYEEIYG